MTAPLIPSTLPWTKQVYLRRDDIFLPKCVIIREFYDMITIEIFTQVWTIRVAGADSWGTIVTWQRQRKVGCSCIQENWLTTTRAYPQPKARDILWYLSWIRKPTRCLWTGQMNQFCPLCEKTAQRLHILFWIKHTQNLLPNIWCFGRNLRCTENCCVVETTLLSSPLQVLCFKWMSDFL